MRWPSSRGHQRDVHVRTCVRARRTGLRKAGEQPAHVVTCGEAYHCARSHPKQPCACCGNCAYV